MNQPEVLIGQTVECIGMMYRSLDSLCARVLPVDPAMFAIMAQGPADDLRILLDDLQKLLAKRLPQESPTAQLEREYPSEPVAWPEAA